MIIITTNVSIPLEQVELTGIRSQGAGGQNVNKVSSAIHLRFDVKASSLPEFYKQRLLGLSDNRVSKEGVIIIKAQNFRTQAQNREDAIQRLKCMVKEVGFVQKARRPTRPTKASKARRLDGKSRRATTKSLRSKVFE